MIIKPLRFWTTNLNNFDFHHALNDEGDENYIPANKSLKSIKIKHNNDFEYYDLGDDISNLRAYTDFVL